MFEVDLARQCPVNKYQHTELKEIGQSCVVESQSMANRWTRGWPEYSHLSDEWDVWYADPKTQWLRISQSYCLHDFAWVLPVFAWRWQRFTVERTAVIRNHANKIRTRRNLIGRQAPNINHLQGRESSRAVSARDCRPVVRARRKNPKLSGEEWKA